jgi:hypothetical protein
MYDPCNRCFSHLDTSSYIVEVLHVPANDFDIGSPSSKILRQTGCRLFLNA